MEFQLKFTNAMRQNGAELWKKTNLCEITHQLTAGEDQVPQERANVTRGSESSNPYMLLAIIS